MTVLFPSLQKLRTIVERLKPMSNILSIRGNNSGCLQLSINTEGVKVQSEWTDCTNPDTHALGGNDDEENDPEQMYTVLVSIKSFSKFLNVHSVCSTTIACALLYSLLQGCQLTCASGLCHHHCLILYVYIGEVADAGGVLTFYIPAIIDDE
jgi:HUS1 checkpoint protein